MNILRRVFITRRLHVIPEISRLWFTAAIHNRERVRSAAPVGAYYHGTSFTKRNYCLLRSLGGSGVNSRYLPRFTSSYRERPRTLFWHHCQKRRLYTIALLTVALYRVCRERIPDYARTRLRFTRRFAERSVSTTGCASTRGRVILGLSERKSARSFHSIHKSRDK